MTRPAPSGSPFGQRLRQWRSRSRMSQLALAHEAGTTPRHLSFLESGRSRPGRDLVLRLAAALEVPIRERNALLAAAGLPPAFPSHDLDDPSLRPVRDVLAHVLQTHEPYPAWVVARGLRFLQANGAAERLLPGLCAMSPRQVVDQWFGQGPFRHAIENWPDVAWAGLALLRREALTSGDPELGALVRYAEGLARQTPPPSAGALPDFPVVCPIFRWGERRVRTISTVMRFDTAVEVTASELRVELMFPADEVSAAFFRDHVSSIDSAGSRSSGVA